MALVGADLRIPVRLLRTWVLFDSIANPWRKNFTKKEKKKKTSHSVHCLLVCCGLILHVACAVTSVPTFKLNGDTLQ